MRLLLVTLLALFFVASARATTVPGNLILTATAVSGSGAQTYNSLSRSSPLTTVAVSGTVTVNGISATGAADGDVLYLYRDDLGAYTTTLTHASGTGSAQLLLPLSVSISGRFGAQFVYQGGYWQLVGYTPA